MVAQILSPTQRTALFDPPSDVATIERLYTLGREDLIKVFRLRRAANRLGYAVQLSYLRHPGRALEPGEVPPAAMLTVLAAQTGCEPNAVGDYAARDTTLREHRAAIERRLRLRVFERADRAMAFAAASEVDTSIDRYVAIVWAIVERQRGAGVVLPVPALLERIALVARAEARRQAFARLGRNLTADQVERLNALLRIGGTPTRPSLAWVRGWPEAPGAGNLKAIVERLDYVRNIGIEAERARRINASRYAVIARETAIMTAQHLTRLENRRRLATLIAFAIEMGVALTDAAILMVEKLVAGMFRRADRTRSERLIGVTSASVMPERLGSYPRVNGLALALREIGRVERPLFTLEWIERPEERRRTTREPNKGEAQNALKRAIFFHRTGRIRDHGLQAQGHRASALSLVASAIVLWNTTDLGAAMRHLDRQGRAVPPDLLQHLFPLGWQHINLTGDYLWSCPTPQDGELRPFRQAIRLPA